MSPDEQQDIATLAAEVKALRTALDERTAAARPTLRLRNTLLSAAAVVFFPLALTAPAFASIPAANGVITACYTANNGSIRVIDVEAGQTCEV